MRHSCAASHSGSQAPCQIGNAAVDTAKSAPLRPSFAARRSSVAAARDAEERLVGQDVLPLVKTELPAGEDLTPGPADGQVHLTHVDLGAGSVRPEAARDVAAG